MIDFMQDRHTREELQAKDLYTDILEERPPQAYNVANDLYEGFYLFVRLAHNCDELV